MIWSPYFPDPSRSNGVLRYPWHYVLSHITDDCGYSPDIFEKVAINFVFHPELNSKDILRADILRDTPGLLSERGYNFNLSSGLPESLSFECTRTIERILLPRNPKIDPSLRQTCRLSSTHLHTTTLLIYTSHYEKNQVVPFYHPPVQSLAFELSNNILSFAYIPLPNQNSLDEDRIGRVAHSLLKAFHKHCVGLSQNYQKRFHHDLLIVRESYQDLYISLKSKYSDGLISNWVEKTDPKKHVFEDIGIATFLILLWERYGQGKNTKFVDLGCGNGVLVSILLGEGYEGWGFDVRSRKTWATFPKHIAERLREYVLLPPYTTQSRPLSIGSNILTGSFEKGSFLISNHADELTPHVPFLSLTTPDCAGFLILACCPYDLSAQKHSGSLPKWSGLEVNREGGGRYWAYCEWVWQLAHAAGGDRWWLAREALRIPSTRNLAIVGMPKETSTIERALSGKPEAMEDCCANVKMPLYEKIMKVIEDLGGRNGIHGFEERALGLKAKKNLGH